MLENEDNYDIYVNMVGSQTGLRLTDNPANDYSPAWSPDGQQIAFLRDLGGGRSAVLLVPPIGGSERTLIEVSASRSITARNPSLAWHPSGKHLAIVDRNAIVVVAIGTREKQQLTFPEAASDEGPAFSPDGRKLVFARVRAASVSDLLVQTLFEDLGPDGQPERLTFENLFAAGPVWTPDGRDIIFSLGPWTAPNLWRVRVSESAGPQRLASVGEDGTFPAISRQGNRLAYVSSRFVADIWRLQIDGRGDEVGPRVKFISSTRVDNGPEYSPDGQRISFRSDRSGSPEIWVCNSDGSNLVQLTYWGGPHTSNPRWSPDGKNIVFISRPEGAGDIYVVTPRAGIRGG